MMLFPVPLGTLIEQLDEIALTLVEQLDENTLKTSTSGRIAGSPGRP
jgi:hypothetical protein